MLSQEKVELLEKIRNEQPLIVVEGKKDVRVLKELGFEKIIEISGKSLEDVIDEVVANKPSEITILTDFDKEGERIASQLIKFFTHHKIKINKSIRHHFKSLGIRKIEELKSFTKIMGDDQNGKIGPIYYKIFNRSRIHHRWNCREAGRDRSDIWTDRRASWSRFRFEGIAKDR